MIICEAKITKDVDRDKDRQHFLGVETGWLSERR